MVSRAKSTLLVGHDHGLVSTITLNLLFDLATSRILILLLFVLLHLLLMLLLELLRMDGLSTVQHRQEVLSKEVDEVVEPVQ